MASRPRRRIALVCTGIALLGLAGTVHHVAVPRLAELPEDFSGSQQAVGTYTGVNPGALAGGHGPVVVTKAPITVTRALQVSPAGDGQALLTLSSAVKAKNLTIPKVTYRYAIDRRTLTAVAPPAGAKGVTAAEGGLVALPRNPSPTGAYRWWDQFTQQSYPLTYTGTQEVAGRSTLVFTTTAKGAVPNPKVLGFPATLDRDQVTGLLPILSANLPASLRERLPELMRLLPARVPVEYRSTTRTTVYADAELGIPLKARLQQSVSTRLKGVDSTDAPVSTVDITTRKDAVARTAEFVSAAAFRLTLIGTWLPAAVGALGAVLLVIGLVLIQQSRRDPWVWVREARRRARRKRRFEKVAYQTGWGAGVVTGSGMAAATRAGEMVSHLVDDVKAEIRGDDVAEVIGDELGRVDGELIPEPAGKRSAPEEPTGSDDVVWRGPAMLTEEQADPLPSRVISG